MVGRRRRQGVGRYIGQKTDAGKAEPGAGAEEEVMDSFVRRRSIRESKLTMRFVSKALTCTLGSTPKTKVAPDGTSPWQPNETDTPTIRLHGFLWPHEPLNTANERHQALGEKKATMG